MQEVYETGEDLIFATGHLGSLFFIFGGRYQILPYQCFVGREHLCEQYI